MFVKTLAALGFVASSFALTITSPGPSAFWVQNTSNIINWEFSSGDPNPIDITVTNSNSSTLNGAFSIQRGVDASNGTFTVTRVTLRVGTGYVVNFVNGTNNSQIFASSQEFEVKKPGTTPATPINGTNTASGSSPSATSPNGSSSASGSGTGSGAGSPTSSSSRGAASSGAATRAISLGIQGAPAIAASALVALLAACAMF